METMSGSVGQHDQGSVSSGDAGDAIEYAGSARESEQLSKQAVRILEQLLTLDAQYGRSIEQRDHKASEALTACTIALSRLAQQRSSEHRAGDSHRNGRPDDRDQATPILTNPAPRRAGPRIVSGAPI
jgi:hypothetical protein